MEENILYSREHLHLGCYYLINIYEVDNCKWVPGFYTGEISKEFLYVCPEMLEMKSVNINDVIIDKKVIYQDETT